MLEQAPPGLGAGLLGDAARGGARKAHRLYEKLGFKAGIEKGFVIKLAEATAAGSVPG